MIDRVASGFHPFVLPFVIGMAFVLGYCVYGIIKILVQLSAEDRKRFGLEHIADFDPEKLGPDLPQRLFRAYRRLMPMYEYLFECSSSVPV